MGRTTNLRLPLITHGLHGGICAVADADGNFRTQVATNIKRENWESLCVRCNLLTPGLLPEYAKQVYCLAPHLLQNSAVFSRFVPHWTQYFMSADSGAEGTEVGRAPLLCMKKNARAISATATIAAAM